MYHIRTAASLLVCPDVIHFMQSAGKHLQGARIANFDNGIRRHTVQYRMSSNKSVRFASSASSAIQAPVQVKRTSSDMDDAGGLSDKKAKRHRPNEDELDDIDEWEQDDDDEQADSVPSERQQLEAKRRRREQRAGQDGEAQRTQINDTTSLAAEGVPIEPFSMEQEETDGTGYFDGDTYVFRRNKDEGEEPDAWLDSLEDNGESSGKNDVDGSVNSGSKESRIFAVVRKSVEKKPTPSIDVDNLSKHELYGKILPLVSDTETVSQAVRRYGLLLRRKHRKESKNNGTKQPSPAPGIEGEQHDNRKTKHEELAKLCLDELTACANALLFKGDVNIYDSTRNDILKLLPQQEVAPQNPTKYPPAQWEYMGNQDGKLHGPYSTEEMLRWTQAGYFVGAQQVKIRTIRKQEPSSQNDLLADLMDDDDDDDDDDVSSRNEGNHVKGPWLSSNYVDFKSYL